MPRFIFDDSGKLRPKGEVLAERYARMKKNRSELGFPMVMSDIEPYISPITKEEIGSRSQHRDHLARHGCVEFGDFKNPEEFRQDGAPPPEDKDALTRDIIDAIDQVEAGNGAVASEEWPEELQGSN